MVRNRNWFVWMICLVPAIALLPTTAGAQKRSRLSSDPPPAVSVPQIAQGKCQGVPSAPIKIEDFTDFECPACRALYVQTLHPLIQQYVSGGKVYLIHHDFPLPMHPYSHKAAYYADAAAAIGEFAPVEDALFTHQPQWAAKGDIQPVLAAVLSPSQLRRVDELAKTTEIHEAVQQDVDLGTHLGVHETPTMYIIYKGKRTPIIGAVSYPILRRYLNALLHQ